MNGLKPAVDSPARFRKWVIKGRQQKMLPPFVITKSNHQPATTLCGGKGEFPMTCTEEYKEHKQTSRSCITNLFRRGLCKTVWRIDFYAKQAQYRQYRNSACREINPLCLSHKKIPKPLKGLGIRNAGDGGRTHTVSPPTDFESVSSANSNTPAYVSTLLVYQPHAKLSRHPRRDFADKFSDFFVKRH